MKQRAKNPQWIAIQLDIKKVLDGLQHPFLMQTFGNLDQGR